MGDDYDGTRLTRRRLLGGVATIGTAAAIGGVSTMARFRDEESSTASVQAGTFDLKLADSDEGFGENGDSVSGELTLPNAKPGETFSGSIQLQNTGSVEADHVELGFSYDETESDGPNGSDEGDTKPGSATGMAKQFEVTTLFYDENLQNDLSDANGNGRTDIDDLSSPKNEGALDNLAPAPSANGGTKSLSVGFRFADDPANNDYQGDELTVTITFALHQTSSQDT
jgi:spore coat-associated protein N